MKSIYISILVFVLLLSNQMSAIAQCAMCRAGIENNVSNGETTIGAGLNMGILYLLSMPYLLALVLGYLWYRNAKKRKGKFLFHGEKY
ncbi:hypothetical protein [Cognataquiflexum aquatile]|jgi:hypothetical protein|uniref:hypothetical protein n=1 Tax=Cognataquiflexum aquatile TaxID=2249427 RepID=UPI000DEA0DB5|nr:hypothetical protein [Cognataquiflexum aquatile]